MHPWMYVLPKVHKVPAYRIIQPTSPEAAELKTLLWSGRNDEYARRLRELNESSGKNFVVTENGVEEIADGEDIIDIRICVQVKKYTITWYFWSDPKYQDLYSQEWRDTLYDAAAECHDHVENGCGLYYRGSNAWHLKTMHTNEGEAHRNHNHYRMAENQSVTPEDFNQHMHAFLSGKHQDVLARFFANPDRTAEQEIDRICSSFTEFYLRWISKNPGSDMSAADQYYSLEDQQLTPADLLEFRLFGAQQEPCRLSVDELTVDYERARRSIDQQLEALLTGTVEKEAVDVEDPEGYEERIAALLAEQGQVEKEYNALLAFRKTGGSRGLGADRAFSRQLPGSQLPSETLWPTVGRDAPPVPTWATTLFQRVDEAMRKLTSKPAITVAQLTPAELQIAGVSLPPTPPPPPSLSVEKIISADSYGASFFSHPHVNVNPGRDVKVKIDAKAGTDVDVDVDVDVNRQPPKNN